MDEVSLNTEMEGTKNLKRGCKSLYVEVGTDNVAALALYSRLGLAPMQDGRLLLGGVPNEFSS